MSDEDTPVEEPKEEITVSPEQLIQLFQQSELRSTDRMVFLRSFEKFYNDVNQARGVLLRDLQEINNSISVRNAGVIPEETGEETDVGTEEE
tara:strand:- start:110 stop:385 length:276 start_codon:yes stop_codon:yes gene_type:complete